MRAFTALALFLALSACTPPAQPASQPASTPAAQTAPNPYAAALTATPASGQWFFNADAGTFAAGFGAPQSEYQLTLVCEAPSGRLTLTSDHALAPDQDTTLLVFTDAQIAELPARSFNEGLPSVRAELADSSPEKAALIAALTGPHARFGVDVAGEIQIFPWDASIARVLAACA
jgi:hypothetical protein